jgi:tetratricopeptide (TPR) repeat protein
MAMDKAGALLAVAVGHHRAGRMDEARAHYGRILAAGPTHAQALHLLGVTYAMTGDPAGAVRWMVRALVAGGSTDDGNLVAALANLAVNWQQMGKVEVAVSCLRAALALDPACHGAWSNLARLLKARTRFEAAVGAFRHALALDVACAPELGDLGSLCSRIGLPDAGIGGMGEALSLITDDPDMRRVACVGSRVGGDHRHLDGRLCRHCRGSGGRRAATRRIARGTARSCRRVGSVCGGAGGTSS